MFFFFICTFRTNVVFVLLFACIVPGVGCIAGVFYNLALGKADQAHNCQVVSFGLTSSTRSIIANAI